MKNDKQSKNILFNFDTLNRENEFIKGIIDKNLDEKKETDKELKKSNFIRNKTIKNTVTSNKPTKLVFEDYLTRRNEHANTNTNKKIRSKSNNNIVNNLKHKTDKIYENYKQFSPIVDRNKFVSLAINNNNSSPKLKINDNINQLKLNDIESDISNYQKEIVNASSSKQYVNFFELKKDILNEQKDFIKKQIEFKEYYIL